MPLRIVITAAAENGAGAEKLFEEQKPGDFVGEGEFRERPEQLCAGLDRRIQPVGAAMTKTTLRLKLPSTEAKAVLVNSRPSSESTTTAAPRSRSSSLRIALPSRSTVESGSSRISSFA